MVEAVTIVRGWRYTPAAREPILTRTLENSQFKSEDPGGVAGDWLRVQVDSAGDVARTDSSSSTPVTFPSTFSGSGVLPSSDRPETEGAIALAGERDSMESLPDSVSGESRQVGILSGSGGHVVRAAIASVIELLGVGIAD